MVGFYEVDCDHQTFNKPPNDDGWIFYFHDPTAYAVASTYFPVSEWSIVKDREMA